MKKMELDIDNLPTRESFCKEHGEFTSTKYLTVWSKCPVCAKDRAEAARKAEQEREAREKIHMWERRLESSGIQKRFRDKSFDNFHAETQEQINCLTKARAYAEDFDRNYEDGRCVLMCGNPGTGKNHLASAIAMHLMKRLRTVALRTAQRMIRDIRDTWNGNGSEKRVIDAYTRCDLLIIDEIGVQLGTDNEIAYLTDIINERYAEQRPTIVISNLDKSGVVKFIGQRAFDRLRENSGIYLEFNWGSQRK